MADNPRRGRNRPDSRAMWEESDRRDRNRDRDRYGGGARDRRDNRDRYRDDQLRGHDRRQRSRSRSPVGERRERYRSRSRDRRDRDRDYGRDRRRGYESTRDKVDGRPYERERDTDRETERGREKDGRRRDEDREEHTIPRGPARRSDARRSVSPQRSPSGVVGRAGHDTHSPLPTRSKHPDRDSGRSSVKGDPDDDGSTRRSHLGKTKAMRDSSADEEGRGRRRNRESDGGEDPMDEDDSLDVEDDEMSAMQSMMGFGGFGSTKGQKVVGNNAGAVYKAKKTEYRQYMNRVGGFNRPLSPGR